MTISATTTLITGEALDGLVTTLAKSKLPDAVSGAVIRQIHANYESIVGLSRDTVAAFIKLAASGEADTASDLLLLAIKTETLLDRAHARTARSEARASITSIRNQVFKGVVAALMALAAELVRPIVEGWLEGLAA